MRSCAAALLLSCVLPAQALKDFDRRVSDYIKLRKTIKVRDLKPTPSSAEIQHHERETAERIREARMSAAQGDVFTPEIAAEFRRLIATTMQEPEAGKIRASLRHAEPVHLKVLRVNQTYPRHVPLQSTPPSLLLNLPPLPPELDYRVVGRDLVLRDTGANLLVDFIANAIP
jgi:hypothetical protein